MISDTSRSCRRRRVRLCAAAAAALATLWLSPVVRCESLWDSRHRPSALLYTDNVAAEIGDAITVLIADSSSFKITGSRAMEKAAKHGSKATVNVGEAELFTPIDLSEESSRKFASANQYSGKRELADSVTATVVDKLPNGNLVIAGRSERDVAGESVVTVLSGIVKPEDIGGANTISSRRVSNLKISYETSGPSKGYSEQGIINKILNFLWPF